MATKTITIFEDDLDGSHADETVTFSLDGAAYEIDLTTEHADDLRAAFERYVKSGRKTNASPRTKKRTPSKEAEPTPAEVRAWAKEQGVPVTARGRIHADVITQYQAAQEVAA